MAKGNSVCPECMALLSILDKTYIQDNQYSPQDLVGLVNETKSVLYDSDGFV